MSLPSDVSPDVAEPALRRTHRREKLTTEQKGWMAAALVAFIGVVYGGPAITRLQMRPSLRQRTRRGLDDARRRARESGKNAQERLRRLAGGSGRR